MLLILVHHVDVHVDSLATTSIQELVWILYNYWCPWGSTTWCSNSQSPWSTLWVDVTLPLIFLVFAELSEKADNIYLSRWPISITRWSQKLMSQFCSPIITMARNKEHHYTTCMCGQTSSKGKHRNTYQAEQPVTHYDCIQLPMCPFSNSIV